LKEPVNYSVLKEAVIKTAKRFPYFSVSFGTGIFWHFLEFNEELPRIQVEEEIPCTAFALKRRNECLYRIIVKGKRISVEFLHILTDGAGALEYLKSLLYTYLTVYGKKIGGPGEIIVPDTPVSHEEFEDGYKKYFKKLPQPAPLVNAWNLPFKLNKRPRMRVLHVEINIEELLKISRKNKVSVTEYFVSVYYYSLQKIYFSRKEITKKDKRKVLRVEIPVNMRKILPSRTMRNFSLFVAPEIDIRLGTYSFEEILKSVHHQLQISKDSKQLSRFLSSNVGYERWFIVRILPLFIKKLAISATYKNMVYKHLTGVVTNLGRVTLPEKMEEFIDFLEFIPPPPHPKVKVITGMISIKNKLRICFCNITQSRELEMHILRHLSGAGIHVKVLNNG
jgi:NRPS condensation-like uncharacterized protein